MATGKAWFKVPESIRFVYRGKLNPYVNGKDLILHTIGDIGVDGALYMAMEFTGEAIDGLSLEGRLTMANMAIEAGGKNGIFRPDEKTVEYVKTRSRRPYTVYESDTDARYADVREYDASRIEPLVAFPHLPENVKPAREAGVEIDQVVIGSCTNGRIEDLREAAAILKNRKAHRNIRLIIIPATQEIYRRPWTRDCLKFSYSRSRRLGADLRTMPRGTYGHPRRRGTLPRDDQQEFRGEDGHPKSEVYLAGPAVAAARRCWAG